MTRPVNSHTLGRTCTEHKLPYTIDFSEQDRQDNATKECERHQYQHRHMTSPVIRALTERHGLSS
jgi:hypothetical protein